MEADKSLFTFYSGQTSFDDYVNEAFGREQRLRAVLAIVFCVLGILFAVFVLSHPLSFSREAIFDNSNGFPRSASRVFFGTIAIPFAWFLIVFLPLCILHAGLAFSCKSRIWSWNNSILTTLIFRREQPLYQLIFQQKDKRYKSAQFCSDCFNIDSDAYAKSYDYASIYKVFRGKGMFVLRVKQSDTKSPRDIFLDETTMEGGSPEDFSVFLDSVLGLGVKRLDRKMTDEERSAWRLHPLHRDYWDKLAAFGKQRKDTYV